MLLFLYGTLKKGRGNHYYVRDSEYIGDAFTDNNYALFVSGLPYMVKRAGSKGVKGEVYDVDAVTLKYIDQLEGHPDFYRRTKITVTLFETGETIECQTYLHPDVFDGQKQLSREFT